MNNEIYRHRRDDKIKWVFTGVAFLLVFLILAGVCLQLFGNGKVKPSEWFKKPETEQMQPSETESNGGAVIGESKEKGIRMLSARIAPEAYAENGVSAQTESAYTLTATLEPENAEGLVDWQVSWVNSASEWASGKTVTDYITVTPVSDGALTANAECKRAFGEQINITVALRGDYDCSASCTCDYTKKLIGFEGFNIPLQSGNSIVLDSNMTSYTVEASTVGISNSFSVNYVFSDYTVDDLKKTGISVDFSAEFKQLCSENEYGSIRFPSSSNLFLGTTLFYGYVTPLNTTSSVTAAQANVNIEFMKQHLDVPVYSVGVYSIRSGEPRKSITIPIYFSESSLPLVVESVSLNESNLLI